VQLRVQSWRHADRGCRCWRVESLESRDPWSTGAVCVIYLQEQATLNATLRAFLAGCEARQLWYFHSYAHAPAASPQFLSMCAPFLFFQSDCFRCYARSILASTYLCIHQLVQTRLLRLTGIDRPKAARIASFAYQTDQVAQ
jgi:hypothetical protein